MKNKDIIATIAEKINEKIKFAQNPQIAPCIILSVVEERLSLPAIIRKIINIGATNKTNNPSAKKLMYGIVANIPNIKPKIKLEIIMSFIMYLSTDSVYHLKNKNTNSLKIKAGCKSKLIFKCI